MLLVKGCAGPTQIKKEDAPISDEFSIPFYYRGLGVAGQPRVGFVPLNRGEEEAVVTKALLESLQDLEMSIVEPPIDLDALIPPEETWKTGKTELSGEIITRHNQKHPDRAVPNNRIYALEYEGSYAIRRDEFRLNIASKLYHKGLGGQFRPFESAEYSSEFFMELIMAGMWGYLGISEDRTN
jgi:hypothetical protein